jgi:uncharacterized membrane protein
MQLAQVENELSFGVRAVEKGAFKGAFAGGEKVLTIHRSQAIASVMGAVFGIIGATTEHGLPPGRN